MKIDRRVFAMKLCWIALAILAIVLSIWGATRSAAAAEVFPVWWSPKLAVESLDKIEENKKAAPTWGRARFGLRELGLRGFGQKGFGI